MEKTRNLSVAEYFVVIQREYLIAEFKKKIYFNPKDKAYYNKVMGFKEEKIKGIGNRNCLVNIFNNEEKMKEFHDALFDKLGRPKFELSEIDELNYFNPGNEFSFRGEIYILDDVRSDGSLSLYSESKQEYEIASKEDVCRIL